MKYWIGIAASVVFTQIGFHLQQLDQNFLAGFFVTLAYIIMYYIGVSDADKYE